MIILDSVFNALSLRSVRDKLFSAALWDDVLRRDIYVDNSNTLFLFIS